MTISFTEAVRVAAQLHDGQTDKGGLPYILHPLSVARRVALAGHSGDHLIVAVLHDIIEDTEATLSLEGNRWLLWTPEFAYGLSVEAANALYSISRQMGEPYANHLKRAAANPIARAVKIADLEDNTDPARQSTAKLPPQLLKRYQDALEMLRR